MQKKKMSFLIRDWNTWLASLLCIEVWRIITPIQNAQDNLNQAGADQ